MYTVYSWQDNHKSFKLRLRVQWGTWSMLFQTPVFVFFRQRKHTLSVIRFRKRVLPSPRWFLNQTRTVVPATASYWTLEMPTWKRSSLRSWPNFAPSKPPRLYQLLSGERKSRYLAIYWRVELKFCLDSLETLIDCLWAQKFSYKKEFLPPLTMQWGC